MDHKDKKFPVALGTRISQSPLKTVFQGIHAILESECADAILFMGDFTEKGQIDGYNSCVRYIAEALQLGQQRRFENIPTGIVPGNHDIDRKLAIQPGVTGKFTPLNLALDKAGLPRVPVTKPTVLDLTREKHKAIVFLINSCWGCGESDFIPSAFREPITAAINGALESKEAASALKDYYDRQLDTPAISEQCVSALIEGVKKTPGGAVPIVVAHHNILPQRLPRLAPYTELVNSGAVRGSLMELDRPALFLHGHIHEEPIEIVQFPQRSPLVVISAPAAVDGFNVIELIFTSHGLPIACNVIAHRFDDSGVFTPREVVKVPLLGPRKRSNSSALVTLYSSLLRRSPSYWRDVQSMANDLPEAPSNEVLVEWVEILACDGSIVIDNYDMGHENWILRAEI